MKRFHLILIAAVVLGLRAPSEAGSLGTIEGTVVDGSGAVVARGVTVSITCGKVRRAAKVDGAGHFSVGGLPEGACTIAAAGNGLAAIGMAVEVAAGSIVTVLVRMVPPAPVEATAAVNEAWPAAPIEAEPGMGRLAPEPAPPPMAMPPRRMAKPGVRAPAPRLDANKQRVAGPRVPIVPARPVKLDRKREGQAGEKVARGRGGRARDFRARDPGAGDAEAFNNFDDVDFDGDDVLELPPMAGWAPVRVFPVPQYAKAYDGPRTDFRETIYWNPIVETDRKGLAEVTFVTSDAVTAFRATVEGFAAGGTPGAGQLAVQSKLPLTLDAHLPVEVTSGDTIRLPVTLSNETETAIDADLSATFGAAFKLVGSPVTGKIRLAAGQHKAVFFPLQVVATDGSGEVNLALSARGLADKLTRTIRVVPRGFPFQVSASGTAQGGATARQDVDLAGALPGSVRATVTMYPSPLAAMTEGMSAMIREPGGCFEQTSSTNYPNIMILGYLGSSDAADPALVERTLGVLDRGYKLLTGYETKQKGYEWFGQTPGHEALTAYGLMEFADMAKVYDVDRRMVDRTADWLMSRRDQRGGFQRSQQALDSFGRATEATTNAYIMWALAEAQRTRGLDAELSAQRAVGTTTKDPYLLALATNTAMAAAPAAAPTAAMVKRLTAMQGKDGSFPGAAESITMSGGESLTVETTALAVLALIKASPSGQHDAAIRTAVDWLNAHRGGYGGWSNTQATVLGLKALTAYSEHTRQIQASGAATLIVNGDPAGTIAFEKGRKDALVWADLAMLKPGKNSIELRLDGAAALPYSIAIEYRSAQPQSSANAKVAVTTELMKDTAGMGDGVTLRTRVENKTASGLPMTLARVGIPGGMVFQTWQLKELRDKGVIDFYETRPREVILYWRALPPAAKKDVDLNLLAAVPGDYQAPASSAYLYYTAEDKAWTAPVKVSITE